MSVYKKLNHILEAYLTDTDKLPEGWKRYNKYQKIGKFVCINCSKERHTTVISPKAEKYILSLNCSGIVTSGAEGKHSAITKYDHVLGNKLDLQPLKGTGSTNKDYAELIIVLLQNEKTVYINMESFKIDDIKEIKE